MEPNELSAMLANLPALKAQHERLGKLIEALEAFVGGGSVVAVAGAGVRHAGKVVLRPDLFFGKSASEATKMYLTMVGHAVSVREITQALLQGGIGSTPEATYANIGSALKRLKKAGEVVSPKRNLWGLTSFYGGAKKKKEQNGEDESEPDTGTAAKATAAAGAGVV